MSINIELKPEVEEKLEQEAAARGVSVETYVGDLIERQFSRTDSTSQPSAEELDRLLDSLAEGSEDRPVLPAEAYTRESIDHDHN